MVKINKTPVGAAAMGSVPYERVKQKALAVNNIVDIIVNADSPNEEKIRALQSLLHSIRMDEDFFYFIKDQQILICNIQSAIDMLTDGLDNPFDGLQTTSKEDLDKFVNRSNFNFISKKNAYNPDVQMVTPKALIKWQAMQILNMYCWFNMPCAVMIDYACCMVVRTHDITYDYLIDMVNDDLFDVVMFTDGNRTTVLKERP